MLPISWSSYKIDTVNQAGLIPHTHTRTSEIIQTFDNDGSILINGHLYKMLKNGLYFIHGTATHFVSPDDINRYNHSILILHTNEVEKICRNLQMKDTYHTLFLNNGGTFCELSPKAVIETDSLLYEIDEIMNGPTDMKYAKLSASLVKLFELGLKYSSKTTFKNSKFGDVLSYISDNALKKISIDEICEKTHISKYHLCRLFKENVGVTIGSFIKTRRLSIAKQLLISTKMPIIEIAYKCGFTDSSFFSKTFTKEFGVNPSEFRNKYNMEK